MDEEALAPGLGWEPETREVASLRSFLEREHQAHQQGREAQYDRPVDDRTASGSAIDRVFYTGVEEGKQRLFVFSCRRNDSRFRPGTRVRVSRGDARQPLAILELVDDRYDGKKYVLRLSGQVSKPEAFESAEPWVLDEDVFDLLDVQLSILREAEQSGFADWLAGSEPAPAPNAAPEGVRHGAPAGVDAAPAGASSYEENGCASRFAEGLEGSIREAFERACRAPRWFAVQGPPGSGKTHLLARLALHFALERGRRVLITAVSHQAIHHALAETYWVGGRMAESDASMRELLDDGFFKLGASRGNNEGLPAGVHAAMRVPYGKRPLIAGATVYAGMNMLAASGGRVPIPTVSPEAAGSRSGAVLKGLFDVVLFDESGQAPLVLALGARLLAPSVVFIGDDAQLPPVVQLPPDEECDPLARVSTIEFVRRRYGDPLMLTETRRLNRELCSIVSDCFYDAALAPTPEAESRALRLTLPPAEPFAEVFRPDRSLVFLDVPHSDCRALSEPEARWAVAIVREAVRCGIPSEEIGVIAPYRAQCNRIRFLLGRRGGTNAATVERFQGQEREMVVISLTSSNRRYLARLAAFLFNPNRLNVAVSRARTKVVLLGSRKALTEAAESAGEAMSDSAASAGFQVFLTLLENAHHVDGTDLPEAVPMPSDASLVRDGAPGEPSTRASRVRPPAARRRSTDLPAAEVFEPGEVVVHGTYGAGRVLSKSVQLIDNRREWVNEVRFNDGAVRLVIPRLSRPAMRKAE
ncbi:MAG: AAA domain-containing protein [Elusimicrobiota bacterium]